MPLSAKAKRNYGILAGAIFAWKMYTDPHGAAAWMNGAAAFIGNAFAAIGAFLGSLKSS